MNFNARGPWRGTRNWLTRRCVQSLPLFAWSPPFEQRAPSRRKRYPRRGDFEKTRACSYSKIAREREGKHVRGLGAFARRPLVVIMCPANRSISRIRTQTVIRKNFASLFFISFSLSLSLTIFNIQFYNDCRSNLLRSLLIIYSIQKNINNS